MFEALKSPRSIFALAVASGVLAVSGCGNTVEGIGNIPMVSCGNGEQPRSNTVNILAVQNNAKIQLGPNIVTDGHGDSATGDFFVESTGDGGFTIGFSSDSPARVVQDRVPGQVAVSDKGENFLISGHRGPHGTTSLQIEAVCPQ